MSRRALPYRVPSSSVVQADEWALLLGEEQVELPDALRDWDYQMDLSLRRRVQIDLDRARAESRLAPGTALNLTVVWTATGSNLRAPAQRIRIEGAGTEALRLSADLRGVDLGGLLVLDTALVLAESSYEGDPTAPHLAGSVLWSDRRTVRLQGDAPQFPMAVIDFAKTSFPNEAAWHLQISGSLLGATMGSLLLLVNERSKVTTTAFANAARARPLDRVVLSSVYADLARTMIEHALRHPEFVDGAEFPEDTLGSTLMSLFITLFPGQSITDLRLRLDQSPSLFASDIQAAVKMFEDV